MRERIEKILALPRSLYWNIRIFGVGGGTASPADCGRRSGEGPAQRLH